MNYRFKLCSAAYENVSKYDISMKKNQNFLGRGTPAHIHPSTLLTSCSPSKMKSCMVTCMVVFSELVTWKLVGAVAVL